MRARYAYTGAVLTCLVVVFGVATVASAGAPTHRFGISSIGEGQIGKERWSVDISRSDGGDGRGEEGARRPCLGVAIVEDEHGFSRDC